MGIPYRFDRTHSVDSVLEAYSDLGAAVETDDVVSVAGRLMLRRLQGRIVFGVMADATGRVQLFATEENTPKFRRFTELSIGDWIGVTGVVMTTRRGELSVRVDDWTVLANVRRSFPDKWHGIVNTETRYRQRYLDLWVSDKARTVFEQRSKIVSRLRQRLENRQFVEVETPVLHPIMGGAAARPFVTHHNALNIEMYLRVAPELYLKRLVVGGMERVFEIGRCFRNEGIDTSHNPEFTVLELYWAYADRNDIMALMEELVAGVASDVCSTTVIEYAGRTVDLTPPWRRATLEEVIAEHADIKVNLDTPRAELEAHCERLDIEVRDSHGPGKLILDIYEKTTEAKIWDPVFVTDYPVEVTPLARQHRSRPGYTESFDAIVVGFELCTAFAELVDPTDQLARFKDQEAQRAAGDDEAMSIDLDYLRALEYGLPPTGGLGIGIDRLVMLLTNTTSIRDAVLFPTLRTVQ